MNKPLLVPQIEYVGDGEIFTEKPQDALTQEEILYTYADVNDYTFIGHYINKNGKIERLYQVK
ncbi:hypothetical protein [Exiguobacterium sp. BG5(2022)]|uniref:hypothetical protein n=1 Tax=Exiguobacterium sp. BG5(2022) TaxID=2962595 RepID=UPI002880C2C3|nr:hypothetical protein [Exiguobacterium sp. BG5(2022)]MDT0193662.1 hypothetical protein [Exiguobacterium sp. BG5(2022)]